MTVRVRYINPKNDFSFRRFFAEHSGLLINFLNAVMFFVLLFLSSLEVSGNDGINKGLYFHSFEVDKDRRTSLDLTPDQPLVFNKGFSMGFDLKLRLDAQTFGYVFRIIGNDTLNVDFLVDISSGAANNNFSLVVKDRQVIHYRNAEIASIIENTWIKVLFVFDPADNHISLSLNGIKKGAICPVTMAGLERFNMCFGENTCRKFFTTDVTPMTVKDIRIFDEKQKLIRHWELAKHSSDCVYDECISDKATVQNPIWKIDSHVKWNKRKTVVCKGRNYHIAFNRNDGHLYFVKNKMLLRYDIQQQKLDTIQVLAGCPFNCNLSNPLVYDANRNVLVSYDFESNRLATFDFDTYRWTNNDTLELTQRFSHHSRLFIAEDDLLVTFGGYGYHRYNSLLYKCKVKNNVWDTINLSQTIDPRYLGGMGRLDDRQLLYFGGFGTKSGEQREYPRNYYDLYSIDIDDGNVKKIWELSNNGENFTNSNSLVIDKKKGKFYALGYSNMRFSSLIKLHEYCLDKPEYRIVGDSIPYYFNDIESYCDLFQTADCSELYAVTSHVTGDGSEINIYSMTFPPLCLEDITQYPSSSTANGLLPGLFLIGLAGIAVLLLYRKRKKVHTGSLISEEVNSGGEPIESKEELPFMYDTQGDTAKPLSIDLLGNFRIVDSNGLDITKQLTPTTTQLFLLLLMSTIKNGKGIATQELKKILWYDKNEFSARNNRNVYIAKLRSILKSFAEVKVIKQDGYWTIQFEKTVFCDYERAWILMKELKPDHRFNKKQLTELVDIALKGTLLPHIQQTEWLEPYQSVYSDRLITCLMECSRRDEVKTDFTLLLKIADAILLQDNIDEDAIKLKCYALFRLGRKNHALQAFNKFTADYKNLLAVEHNLVFEELIKPV